jgi:hypothetical protein
MLWRGRVVDLVGIGIQGHYIVLREFHEQLIHTLTRPIPRWG